MNSGGAVNILDLLAGGKVNTKIYNEILDVSIPYTRMVKGDIGPKSFAFYVYEKIKKHPKLKKSSFNGEAVDRERTNLQTRFRRFHQSQSSRNITDIYPLIRSLTLWGDEVIGTDPVVYNCRIVLIKECASPARIVEIA